MNGGDGNDTLVSSSIGDTGSWIQSILNDYPNVTYNSTTGNFYQVVSSPQTLPAARAGGPGRGVFPAGVELTGGGL